MALTVRRSCWNEQITNTNITTKYIYMYGLFQNSHFVQSLIYKCHLDKTIGLKSQLVQHLPMNVIGQSLKEIKINPSTTKLAVCENHNSYLSAIPARKGNLIHSAYNRTCIKLNSDFVFEIIFIKFSLSRYSFRLS